MASTSRTVKVIFSGSAARLAAAAKQAEASLDGIQKKADTVGAKLTSIGKVTAIAALAGGAIALTAALRPALGALLLLPGAALAAGAVFATLKVGTAGVGDALKALATGDAKAAAEALGKLSPNARSAVLAMDQFRQKFGQVKTSVQDRLFAGLNTDIDALGRTYMPILNTGLTQVAGGLNGFVRSSIAAANTPFVSGAVANILASTGRAMTNLAPSGGHLVTIFAALGQAAGPLIERAAQVVTQFLGQKAAFLSSAAGAEWLRTKIAEAMNVLSQLFAIVRNVGSLLGSVFNAAMGPGNQLLATLVNLTAQAAAWAKTAEGQQQLANLFRLLVGVLQGMLPILGLTGQAILAISNFVASLPAPVQSVVTSFGSWALVAGLLLPKVVGLVSGLKLVGGALSTAGGWIASAAGRWPLLGTAAKGAATATEGGVGSILAAVGRAAAGMVARAAVMAGSWLVAMGPIGWIVAAVIAAVALIVMNWDKVKAALVAVGQFFSELPAIVGAALSTLGSAIATGATTAWNWLVTTASTAISAALAWLAALPGRVAYALGYLAGMVYNGALAAWRFLSETVPAAIEAAITWLSSLPGRVVAFLGMLGTTIANGARTAWNWLLTTTISVGTSVITWVAALPGKIGSFIAALPGILGNAASAAWNGFKSTTVSVATGALDFIRSIPGRITGFFSAAGSWLVNAGRAIIEGLWNGLKSMAQGVLDWIANLGRQVAAGFKAAVGIHSPSKVFADHGVNIGKGLIVGIERITPKVLAATRGLAADATAAASPIVQASRGKVGLASGAQTVVDALGARDAAPTYVTVKIGERELEALVDTRVGEANRELRRRVGV